MDHKPRIVHLKRRGGVEIVSCDVYIGRAVRLGGWNLPQSKWANPYSLSSQGFDRKRVIAMYDEYVRGRPDLLAAIPELEGKTLGCWCSPDECHGDVLVKLFEEHVAKTSSNDKTTEPA